MCLHRGRRCLERDRGRVKLLVEPLREPLLLGLAELNQSRWQVIGGSAEADLLLGLEDDDLADDILHLLARREHAREHRRSRVRVEVDVDHPRALASVKLEVEADLVQVDGGAGFVAVIRNH